uniref:Uncharacterized protein n=1 Tax=Anopheles coluzzii TaxID=1518534 RepID=A0A8W7Q3E1_ANOCL
MSTSARSETVRPENRAPKLTTADLHPSLCPGDDPELINYERFNSPSTGRLGIVLAADLQENGAQSTHLDCPGIAKMLCANHEICGLRRADIPCLPAMISLIGLIPPGSGSVTFFGSKLFSVAVDDNQTIENYRNTLLGTVGTIFASPWPGGEQGEQWFNAHNRKTRNEFLPFSSSAQRHHKSSEDLREFKVLLRTANRMMQPLLLGVAGHGKGFEKPHGAP